MNAKTWFVYISLFAVVFGGCSYSSSRATESRASAQDANLPEFIDDATPRPGINVDPDPPRQEVIFSRNYASIKEILRRDSTLVREEMIRRLGSNQPMSLRLLAAAVLVFKNVDQGKRFLQSQAREINNNLDDVYITLSEIDSSGHYLNGTDTDMSWAEDLMVDALQNRTLLNSREALRIPENIRSYDKAMEVMEVRELAAGRGRFPEILEKMRSEKALPVIISLIREGLVGQYAIASLGRYKDKRVELLLLEILNQRPEFKHRDTYRFAVSAAVESGLKSAVPILLRHLGDSDSYKGIRALADASAIAAIKRAFPTLKSDARIEAEITIVHLRGGDILPSLLVLLKRRNPEMRRRVIMSIEKLKDARTVVAMTEAVCNDPDWFVRSMAIRTLTGIKTREAIAGLINGLGCDYSKLEEGKVTRDHNYNREYRNRIVTSLKEITGKDFGTDQKEWLGWLDQQKTL